MTGEHYMWIGYGLGLGVMWGYALDLWITGRVLRRRENSQQNTKSHPDPREGAHSMIKTARLVATVAMLGIMSVAGAVQNTTTRPALPPGHPPTTPSLPPGHPPLAPQMPPGHPPIGSNPQPVVPDRADVSSVDAILTAYYETLSGAKGVDRDWNRFRSLFMPNARLVTVKTSGDRGAPFVMTVEDYVSSSADYYRGAGYHETELFRRTDAFGGMAHVLSTYASRRGTPDAAPYARGLNSMQLLYDGDRWWIVTIMWDHERGDRPLPPEYLPPGG